MFRLITRIFLIVYFLMPFAAGILLIQTLTQIRDDITPIYNNANNAISNAAEALETELSDLGDNFTPLVNTVNSIRNVLQNTINFLRGTVFTVIDVVNRINPVCNFGNSSCIPKNFNPQIPNLINLSFLNEISDNISIISTQMNNVITTTSNVLNGYLSTLTMAVMLFMAWLLITPILFYITIYRSLWK